VGDVPDLDSFEAMSDSDSTASCHASCDERAGHMLVGFTNAIICNLPQSRRHFGE
jgi:hypothetical protein